MCLFLLFTINISALSIDEITPTEEFLIYSSDPDKVAKTLGIDEAKLAEQIKSQKILFLAVNSENTKQIQLTYDETEFSDTVGNLSNLSETSIKSLLPDITGLDNIKGNIVLKDNQKFVKINLMDSKSGYILTQYFTVSENKLYSLSFYTEPNTDTSYIETVFPTNLSQKNEINIESSVSKMRIFAICGTVIFFLAFLIILITVIKDLIKKSASV